MVNSQKWRNPVDKETILIYQCSAMTLTLNQFLLLVLTVAAVVTVTFLVLLFAQLRKTAKEGEKALSEMRELTKNLNETTELVQGKINDVDDVLKSTKKAASGMAEMTKFLTKNFLKPSSKYWPFLAPLINLGWRQLKKRKKNKED